MAGGKKHRRPDTPPVRLNSRTVEIVVYGLLILFLGLSQAAPRGWPILLGGRPLLLIPLTVAIAMFAGPVGGAYAGVAAGCLWGLYSGRLFGFHALLLMAVGCTAGLLVRLLLRNNLLSAALLCGGGTVAVTLLDWLCFYVLPGAEGMFRLLWHTVVPNTVYTLVLALPIYMLVRALTKWLKRWEKTT